MAWPNLPCHLINSVTRLGPSHSDFECDLVVLSTVAIRGQLGSAPPQRRRRAEHARARSTSSLSPAADLRRRHGASARQADRRLGMGGAVARASRSSFMATRRARRQRATAHGPRHFRANGGRSVRARRRRGGATRSRSTTCSSATCGSRRASRTWSSASRRANGAAREIASAHDSLHPAVQGADIVVARSEERLRRRRVDAAPTRSTSAPSPRSRTSSRASCASRSTCRSASSTPRGAAATSRRGSAASAQHLSDSAWRRCSRARTRASNAIRDALRARLGALPTRDAGLVDGRAVWADPSLDDSRMDRHPRARVLGGATATGNGRRRVVSRRVRPERERRARGVTLALVAIDDDDITWVNGVEIGRTNGYNVRRAYRIPPTRAARGTERARRARADGGGGGGINGAVIARVRRRRQSDRSPARGSSRSARSRFSRTGSASTRSRASCTTRCSIRCCRSRSRA